MQLGSITWNKTYLENECGQIEMMLEVIFITSKLLLLFNNIVFILNLAS